MSDAILALAEALALSPALATSVFQHYGPGSELASQECLLDGGFSPETSPYSTSTASTSSSTSFSSTSSAQPIGLRDLVDPASFHVGVASAFYGARLGEPAFAATVAREFNQITPENDTKWGPLQPSPGVWDFTSADRIVDFALAHGMKVKGHVLVWHEQLPAWLTAMEAEGVLTPTKLREIVRRHVYTVVGHFRGRIAGWDVVNVAVRDGIGHWPANVGGDGDGAGAGVGFGDVLRDTMFSRFMGPSFVGDAFRWAHEADPEAVLLYNDYSIDGLCPKSDATYYMVQQLLRLNVPVHGVGFQGHFQGNHGESFPGGAASIAANLRRFRALGLRVNLSEVDMAMGGWVEAAGAALGGLDAVREMQRKYLLDIFMQAALCSGEEGSGEGGREGNGDGEGGEVGADRGDDAPPFGLFDGITMWGVQDDQSWVCGEGGVNMPLLFDAQCKRKPAYSALADVCRAVGGDRGSVDGKVEAEMGPEAGQNAEQKASEGLGEDAGEKVEEGGERGGGQSQSTEGCEKKDVGDGAGEKDEEFARPRLQLSLSAAGSKEHRGMTLGNGEATYLQQGGFVRYQLGLEGIEVRKRCLLWW